MVTKNKHLSSSLDEFLSDEKILEGVEATAIKRVIAYQIQKEMAKKHLTKSMMAKRMNTSRAAVERLFDPENDSITLVTLNRVANALGKKLKVELV